MVDEERGDNHPGRFELGSAMRFATNTACRVKALQILLLSLAFSEIASPLRGNLRPIEDWTLDLEVVAVGAFLL